MKKSLKILKLNKRILKKNLNKPKKKYKKKLKM